MVIHRADLALSETTRQAVNEAWKHMWADSVDKWDWIGKCFCCGRRYGRDAGAIDGLCKDSYPWPVAGAQTTDSDVLRALEAVGGLTIPILLEAALETPATELVINWHESVNALRLQLRPTTFCPRCRTWLSWLRDYQEPMRNQLMASARWVAQGARKEDRVEDDALVSPRTRFAIDLLRMHAEKDHKVLLVAPQTSPQWR
jgi:hypothetical protein